MELEAIKLQPRKVGGRSFLQKILNGTAHSLFSNPSKNSLNITLLSLELTRWFAKLKMVISELFKSHNLNQKWKVMHWWSRRGQNEDYLFSLLLFFGCSFRFAFQRWFVKLEKSLKMGNTLQSKQHMWITRSMRGGFLDLLSLEWNRSYAYK